MSSNGHKRKRYTEDIGNRGDSDDSDDSDHEGPPQGCSWWCCRWWRDRQRRRADEAAAKQALALDAQVDNAVGDINDEVATSTSAESEPHEGELFPLFIVDHEEFEVINSIVQGLTEPDWGNGPHLPVYLETRTDFNAANRVVQDLRTQRANDQLVWEGNNANKRRRVEKCDMKRAESGRKREVKDSVEQVQKDGFTVRDASSSPADVSEESAMDKSSPVDEPTDNKGRNRRKRGETGSTTFQSGSSDASRRPTNTTPRDVDSGSSENRPLTPTIKLMQQRSRDLKEQVARMGRTGDAINILPTEIFPSLNTPGADHTNAKRDRQTPEELQQSFEELREREQVAGWGIDSKRERRHREEREQQQREREAQNREAQNQATRQNGVERNRTEQKGIQDVMDLTGDQDEPVVKPQTMLKRQRSGSRDDAPPTTERQKEESQKKERGADAKKKDKSKGRSPVKTRPFMRTSPAVTRSQSPVKTTAPPPSTGEESESFRQYKGLLDNAKETMAEGTPLPSIPRIVANSVSSQIRSTSSTRTGAAPQQRAVSGNGRQQIQPDLETPGRSSVLDPTGGLATRKAKPPKTTQKVSETETKSSKPPVKPKPSKPPPITVEDLQESFGDERNWPENQRTQLIADILRPKSKKRRPFGTTAQTPTPHTPLKSPFLPDTRSTNVFDRSYTDGKIPRPMGTKLFRQSAFDEDDTELGNPEMSSTPAPGATGDGAGYPALPMETAQDVGEVSMEDIMTEEDFLKMVNDLLQQKTSELRTAGLSQQQIDKKVKKVENEVYNMMSTLRTKSQYTGIYEDLDRMDWEGGEEGGQGGERGRHDGNSSDEEEPGRTNTGTFKFPSPSGSSDSDDESDDDGNPGKDREDIGNQPIQDDSVSREARARHNRLYHQNMLSRDFPNAADRRNFTRNLHMFARQLRNIRDPLPYRFLEDMASYYPAEIAALTQPESQATEEGNDPFMSVAWRVALIAEGRNVAPYRRAHWGYHEWELWDSDSEHDDLPNDAYDGGGHGGGEEEYGPGFDDVGYPSLPPTEPRETDGSSSDDDDNGGPSAPAPDGAKTATISGQIDPQPTRTSISPHQTVRHHDAPSTQATTGQTTRPPIARPLFGLEAVPAGYGGFRSTTTVPAGRKTSITSAAAKILLEKKERLQQTQHQDSVGNPKKPQPTTERPKSINGGQNKPPPTGPSKVDRRVPTGPTPRTKPRINEGEGYRGSSTYGGNGNPRPTSRPVTPTDPNTGGGYGNGQYGGPGRFVNQTGVGTGGRRHKVWIAEHLQQPSGTHNSPETPGRNNNQYNPYQTSTPPTNGAGYGNTGQTSFTDQEGGTPSHIRPTTPQGHFKLGLGDKKRALKDMGVDLRGDSAVTIEQKWQKYGCPLPSGIQGESNQHGATASTNPTVESPLEPSRSQSTPPTEYTPLGYMKSALKRARVRYPDDIPGIKAAYEKLLRDRRASEGTASTDSGVRTGIPTGPLIQRQPTPSSTNHFDPRNSFRDRDDRPDRGGQAREYPPQPGPPNIEQGVNIVETSEWPDDEDFEEREEMMAYLDANHVSYNPNIGNIQLSTLDRNVRNGLDSRNGRTDSQGGTDRLESGAVAPPSMGPDEIMDYLDEQGVHYPRNHTPAVLWKICQAVQNGGKFRKREGPPPRRQNAQSGGRTDREGSTRPAPTPAPERRGRASLESMLDFVDRHEQYLPNRLRGDPAAVAAAYTLTAKLHGEDARPQSTNRRDPNAGRHSGDGGTPFSTDTRHRSDEELGRDLDAILQGGSGRPPSTNRRDASTGRHSQDSTPFGTDRRRRTNDRFDHGGGEMARAIIHPIAMKGVEATEIKEADTEDREIEEAVIRVGSHEVAVTKDAGATIQIHLLMGTTQQTEDQTAILTHPTIEAAIKAVELGAEGTRVHKTGEAGFKGVTAVEIPTSSTMKAILIQDDRDWQDNNNWNNTPRGGHSDSRGSGEHSSSGGWKRGAKQFSPQEIQTPAPPPKQPKGVWTRDSPYQLRSSANGNNGGGFEVNPNGTGGRRGGRGGNVNGQWQRNQTPESHQTPHIDDDGDLGMDDVESGSVYGGLGGRGGRGGRGRGRGGRGGSRGGNNGYTGGQRGGDTDMDSSGPRGQGGRGGRGRGDGGTRRPRGPRGGGRGGRGGSGGGDVDMGDGNGWGGHNRGGYVDDGSPERGRRLSVSYDRAFDISDLLNDNFALLDRSIWTESSDFMAYQGSSHPSSIALTDGPIFRDPFALPTRSPSIGLENSRIFKLFKEPLSPKTIPSSPPPGYTTETKLSPPLPASLAGNLVSEETDPKDKPAATLSTPSPDKSSSQKSKRTWTSPYRGRGAPKRHKRKSYSEEDFVPFHSDSKSPPSSTSFSQYMSKNGVPPSPPISSRTRLRFRNAEKGNAHELAFPLSPPISSRTRSRFRDAERGEEGDGLEFGDRSDRRDVRRILNFGQKVEKMAVYGDGGQNEEFNDNRV
ncbi:hypothetical protein E2P81_ATG11709 [Venturia nashicola]|nr:hypothetical protein E2P81_ATG11709 [Venturia nashicola]